METKKIPLDPTNAYQRQTLNGAGVKEKITLNPISCFGSSVTLVRVELWELFDAGKKLQKAQGPERVMAPGPACLSPPLLIQGHMI